MVRTLLCAESFRIYFRIGDGADYFEKRLRKLSRFFMAPHKIPSHGVRAAVMPTPETVLFTLLICTYNRASLLRRCLEAIAALSVSAGVSWEVLVVDNASTDDTAAVVKAFEQRWPGLAVRYLREERPGVAYARKTGIAAAAGEWVVYVDDDCILERDWLDEAARFVETHPDVGAFGGRNVLEWEYSPDDLSLAYGESLARQDWGDEPKSVAATGKHCFCGAGLALRRDALLATGYLEKGQLRGRHPGSLAAGEDTEVQLVLRNAGWQICYVPTLRLRHWIPAQRMTLKYLKPLHHGFGMTEPYLRLLGERRALTLSNRWLAFRWAVHEMGSVLGRFWLGFVRYKHERPTWVIRLWFAMGYLKGALRLLLLGNAR